MVVAIAVSRRESGKDSRSRTDEARKVVVQGKGSPPGQVRELKRIVRGFPEPESTRVVIGRPPRGYGFRRPGTVWIYYDIRAGDTVEYVHGKWQALVTSGVLRARSRARRWPSVLGHTFTMVLRNGKRRFDSEGPFGHAFQQAVRQASVGRLREILGQSSAAAGVSLEVIRFAHPLGRPLPEVTVVTSDPREFARNAPEKLFIIGRPIVRAAGGPLAEGLYVYVKSDDGTWVDVSGYAVRLAAGVGTTNTSFSGASSTQSG